MRTEGDMYHRIYAQIDVDAIRYNIQKMQCMVKIGMKTMIIIKADAYGHGACELAHRLDDLADYYGVATIDEAVELREAGITKPILNIGYTPEADFLRAIQNDVTIAVYDVDQASKLSDVALAWAKNVKVHIKVDTGMSRIGFSADQEGIQRALLLKDMPCLEIEGIFTHYAKADEYDKKYAKLQKDRFLQYIQGLKAGGIDPQIKHIDNSAGAMELQDDEFDMVRLGIVTYGLYPSEEVNKSIVIKPAMKLVAHVAHVKTLPAGVGVGYGWTYTTDKTTRVATITVGYADGYPRALSNCGRVLIHGQYAPIIGRVCMDQIMVDVSDIPGVKLDDEVVLIGEDMGNTITVEEVAEPANSFNYELVCNISRRVPRVYVQQGNPTVTVNYLLK